MTVTMAMILAIIQKYKGGSKNIFQNGAIPLIFKTWKIQNICFVANLFVKYTEIFCDDDIIVTLVLRTKLIYNIFSTSLPSQLTSTKQH